MGIFDDAGATISTVGGNAISSAESAITSISGGLASGLSAITDTVGGVLSTVSRVFKQTSNVKLPLPNPLFDYASYSYVISIGVLTDEFANHPDTTYRAGKPFPLLLKSANADPNNRVNTPYGKFDFFIDDVKIESLIGHEAGMNTNATGLEFKIIEPYSMGLLFIAIQDIAQKSGHKNWRSDAPFIMAIEFRGNTETGQIKNIPNTARYIPFQWTDLSMTVSEKGAVYTCKGLPWNQPALSDANAKFKSDMAAKGSSVQEMLQTGEKSLQASLNAKLRDVAKTNGIEQPDEILILFPKDISSAANSNNAAGATESKSSATVNPNDSASSQQIYASLGVSRSAKSGLLEQTANVNAIGNSKMGFDETRKASAPVGSENKVWNDKTKIMDRSQNNVDPKVSDFKFRQDTDITNAINQVILNSNYIVDAFNASNLTPEGYRGWFGIDVQVYNNGEVSKVTGVKPKLLVYRVVEYNVHASKGALPVNKKPPGYDQLKLQAVKQYDYIYTGKNVDVIRFNINYEGNFYLPMSPDGLQGTQDNVTAKDSGGADNQKPTPETRPVSKGATPDSTPGVGTSIVKFVKTLAGTDKLGGGGAETQATRAARLFHDSVNRGTDMTNLEIEIIGDPYWIAQSGMGNYTAQPTQFYNLNTDGSVSYQNGEVDCVVNFRTPIDINQTTGLYDFGGKSSTAPIMQFSGLYQVTQVYSTFANGQFKQTLTGLRRPLQESSAPALTATQTFSTTKTVPVSNVGSSAQNILPGVGAVDANGSPVGNNGWGEG